MRAKEKSLRYYSALAVSCSWIVLLVVGVIALHGCNRVSDEQLAQAVETAMKRSILLNKKEILKNVMNRANKLAVQELDRLNTAEKVYDTQVFFDMIGRYHPMGYGFWFKIKRGFSSYDIFDVRESDSLFHKYEVFIEYKYDVIRTHQFASAYEGTYEKAEADFNFQKIGQEGSWEFLYRFTTDFEWDGEEPEFVRAKGYQVPNYSSGSPVATTRTIKYKTTKGAMPSSLARQRRNRSTSPSKKPPSAERAANQDARQQPENGSGDTAKD